MVPAASAQRSATASVVRIHLRNHAARATAGISAQRLRFASRRSSFASRSSIGVGVTDGRFDIDMDLFSKNTLKRRLTHSPDRDQAKRIVSAFIPEDEFIDLGTRS